MAQTFDTLLNKAIQDNTVVKPNPHVPKSRVIAEFKMQITPEERGYAKLAKQLDIETFPLIQPLRGTVSFILKTMGRDNAEIRSYFNYTIYQHYSTIRKIIKGYDGLDEYSKKRHDCFDYLCIQHGMRPQKLIGFIAEGASQIGIDEIKAIVNSGKMVFFKKVIEMMEEDTGFKDRELFARVTGLVSNAPIVAINNNTNNSTTNNNLKFQLPKFTEVTRNNEQVVSEAKQLTAGTTDYIDAEVIEKGEEDGEPIGIRKPEDINVNTKEFVEGT